MGLTAVPLILALGVGVDLSRLALAKAALQHAADSAALAGATAYQSDQTSGSATTVANNYFAHSAQGLDASVTSSTAAAAAGQVPGGGASYNVTFDATATMPTTFMALANIMSMTIKAHAVAANTAAGVISQPVVTLGPAGSTANDWNSAYMYGVPNGSDGKPDFTQYPPIAEFYEVASNCGNVGDKHGNIANDIWSYLSRCNGKSGATVPAIQHFPKVLATQPLAFLLINMNNGQIVPWNQGYGHNHYGAAPGDVELLTSATMSLNKSPSENTDNSAAVAIVRAIVNFSLNQTATKYSDLKGTAQPNCALQIQQVDPNNLPHDPPYPGQCFSTSDPRSGSQYANLSCAQMAGRTFMYWWNDMGAPNDDYDYKNLYYTIRCVPGSTDPNGGVLYADPPSPTPAASTAVMLIK